MRTGFAAVRVGNVMFTIPFVFAWYPELLLIEEAVTVLDDNGQRVLIEGNSAGVDWPPLTALLLRLILVLYLLASALARYDRGPINRLEMALRLLAALLVLWKTTPVMWVGLGLAAVLIGSRYLLAKRKDHDSAQA